MSRTSLVGMTGIAFIVLASGVQAETLLGGKRAKFRNAPEGRTGSAVIAFARDPALSEAASVVCPQDISLRISASSGYDVTVQIPCGEPGLQPEPGTAGWKAISNGFRYLDRDASVGGVQKILYKGDPRRGGKLLIKMKGAQYQTLSGPLPSAAGENPYVDVLFSVGDNQYCGRFQKTRKRNDEKVILFVDPSLACKICGDRVISSSEGCDDGNVTAGDGCSDTCTVEDGFVCSGEPSQCSSMSDLCPPGQSCAAFNIVPGPGGLSDPPGVADTFVQLADFLGGFQGINITNVADGEWGPSPIMLAKGSPDADNVAPLTWVGESFLGATFSQSLQVLAVRGTLCLHIEQDPAATGWIACDGGSEGDVKYSVDSNFEGAADPPVLTIPSGADPEAPAGTALLRVHLQVALSPNNDADCTALDWSSMDVIQTAFTTRTATSEVIEPIVPTLVAPDQHGQNQSIVLSGLPFGCSDWGQAGGANASIAAPFGAIAFPAPVVNEAIDSAMLARFELLPAGWVTGDEECGNGLVEAGEFCDDGGTASGDGCSATCMIESGWDCTGSAPSVCHVVCGDGFILGAEACDDGDTESGDGCSATCTVEDYWSCVGEPSECQGVCGDGHLRPPEDCDDGGTADGDGCSATCAVEDFWGCTTEEPSRCSKCGDGITLTEIGEQCDDGNTSNGDCCSGDCLFEASGSVCTGDRNVCTNDVCDGAGQCQHVNNSNSCDDGSLCTVNDQCIDGNCVGDLIEPWLNEVDYSSKANCMLNPFPPCPEMVDYEEFVEIAAPAGMDLGGYQIVDIDGLGVCCGLLGGCGTLCGAGDPVFIATIPPNSVVEDKDGTGVGYFTVCFEPTSYSVNEVPGVADKIECDFVYSWPGSDLDSNLGWTARIDYPFFIATPRLNGAGGLLLYPPSVGPPVDGVVWEGWVPMGDYADDFAAVGALNIGTDPGNGTWVDGSGLGQPRVYSCPGRSLANISSELQRPEDPNSWVVTSSQGNPFSAADDVCGLNLNPPAGYGVTAHTPGKVNSGQTLTCGFVPQTCGDESVQYGEDCESNDDCADLGELPGDFICAPPGDPLECACVPNPPCGNGILDPGEQCDLGSGNSDEQLMGEVGCRTDCTPARCGDGIVDPGLGENCESGTECGGGDVCFECTCGDQPMGALSFTVATGSSALDACSDSIEGSLLATDGGPSGGPGLPIGVVCNGSQGDFTPGPIVLFAGRLDSETNVASLRVDAPVVIKAHLDPQKPGCGGECVACWRIEQDPANVGFIDCDAGSGASASLVLDSNSGLDPPLPVYDPTWLMLDTSGDQGAGTAVVRVLVKRLMRNGTGSCPPVNDPLWASATALRTAFVTGQAVSTINDPLVCPLEVGGIGCPDRDKFQVTLTGAGFNCAYWPDSSGGAKLVSPFVNLNEDLADMGEGDIAQVLKLAD